MVEVVTTNAFVSNAARPAIEEIPEFISHTNDIDTDSDSDSDSDINIL